MNMKSNLLLEPFFTIALDGRKLKFLTCYYSRHQCFNQGILVHCIAAIILDKSVNHLSIYKSKQEWKNIINFNTIHFRIMRNYRI